MKNGLGGHAVLEKTVGNVAANSTTDLRMKKRFSCVLAKFIVFIFGILFRWDLFLPFSLFCHTCAVGTLTFFSNLRTKVSRPQALLFKSNSIKTHSVDSVK